MSRSKKQVIKGPRPDNKTDLRRQRNRGFRRHVKLKLKAGEFDLPDAPRRMNSPERYEE